MAKQDDPLERLERRVCTDPQFSEQDVALIHEVLRAYRGWKSLGWAAKWVTMILASLAGALMAWKTVAEEIRKWLTG
jgi:hypothetical protein